MVVDCTFFAYIALFRLDRRHIPYAAMAALVVIEGYVVPE